MLRNTINVVKQQGNISEQTLTLFVDHTPFTARLGMHILTYGSLSSLFAKSQSWKTKWLFALDYEVSLHFIITHCAWS